MLTALALCAGCAVESPTPASPDLATQVGRRELAAQDSVVVSRDAERRVPTMMWAPSGAFIAGPEARTPEAAAWDYLKAHASHYRLSPAALGTAYVHHVHDTGRGGIIVFFRQRVGDVEVARTELKVLMTRDLSLVALTGNLHDGVDALLGTASGLSASPERFSMPPSGAVLGALEDLYGLTLSEGAAVQPVATLRPGVERFELTASSADARSGITLLEPATVQRVYLPFEGTLRPAYSVDLLAERAGGLDRKGYEYLVDAVDGRPLRSTNRVFGNTFSYRVWADADGTPQDGPLADFTPYPYDSPNAGYDPGFVAPRDITWAGRPSNGPLGVDPWLDANASQAAGNNVRAYADHVNPDGYTEGQDLQAPVGPGPRQFHYDFDPALEPIVPGNPNQTRAAIVSLFYTTNWLHDYFYESGFTEVAGNAQQDNLGRGGVANDPLLAEAQNLGPTVTVRNNAYMYVPKDGTSPRMEMFLWEVPETRNVRVGSTDYATGRAEFGQRTFDLRDGRLVLANSGTSTVTTTACTALTNDVTGAIVLADRGGGCSYELKAVNAQSAGAAGLIVLNHIPGAEPPVMFEADASLNPTLPVLSVTYEAGVAFKELLRNGAVTGTMSRRLTRPERDGTIDNTVVAHEWGHLLHLRLVSCAEPQCLAQSEGWADFIALHLMVRSGDDLDGTYGVGGYAAFITGDSTYYGARRVPYSRNPARNALRFRHLSESEALPDTHPLRDNYGAHADAHNAGEVWASMLFDGYLALIEQVGKPGSDLATFADAKRRMADYVVEGMKLAPVDPTFTEQRDALLMAAVSTNAGDARLLAQAFARRGAGTCASSPPRKAQDFDTLTESELAQPDLRFELEKADDSERSCDAERDDVLDAGEAGLLRLKVTNQGLVAAEGVTIAFASNLPQVMGLPSGDLTLPTLLPFTSTTLTFPISLPQASVPTRVLELTLTPPATLTCDARPRHLFARIDHDLGTDSRDTVESPVTAWTATVLEGSADQRWQRVVTDDSTASTLNHVWHMKDDFDFADTALVSPPLKISNTAPFTLRFDHRHAFAYIDRGPGRRDYWTGGVVELSVDGGQTWEDVNKYVTPGYGGTLDATTSNKLAGRPAYVDRSSSWPALVPSPLMDFGTRFKGKTLQLRFRFGSPWLIESQGWDIDDITLGGVDEKPFSAIVDDAGACQLVADAGVDQFVESGAQVTLQGTGTLTPHGGPVTYFWRQTGGTPVALTGADTASPRFTAPTVTSDTKLSFGLTVASGDFSATDPVDVTVKKTPGPGPTDPKPDPPEGGCSMTPETPTRPGSGWLAGVLMLLLRAWSQGPGRARAHRGWRPRRAPGPQQPGRRARTWFWASARVSTTLAPAPCESPPS
ncbi:M36 family metallopeptidase [Myxococcus sp. K15C18031901]|uniref:M36 family metallopeptidase n=1 Tax=Myxococcus dinghuensis TaxID=2906761 RepID=UPI0020A73E42|nr:M36 family metallopeptidase [Myxococcus dinghuensis]MCP3101099.1 M36 family metallopeptidase [Myxococcus dinghuensis]